MEVEPAVCRMENILNFINGQFTPSENNQWIEVEEPATGQVYARIPRSSTKEVEKAVLAANHAAGSWQKMSLADRSAILHKIADLIDENHDRLAHAESKDNGKPLWLAKKVDIPRASANMRFFANAITQVSSDSHKMEEEDAINFTLKKPLGVVACISPWNLPLYLFTWKVAPALAAGNCVLAKPSEVTPYTAYLFSQLCKEAGLPDGVLNVLHGYGGEVGHSLVNHKEVKAISFTGGTETGKKIAATAAPQFKKLSLELGGKNPAIVFDDCNFEKTVSEIVRLSFSNQGEICLCGSRIYVQQAIYEQFKDAFIERVKALKVGDPLEADSNMGAIVSEQHYKKVLSYVQLAKEEGGRLLVGGRTIKAPNDRCKDGYFIAPTVFEGLTTDCRTNQEEIFGPVVTLQSFETMEEVVELANGVNYGLSATIWTDSLQRAHAVSDALESGVIWINCWLLRDLRTPFGGLKQSGVGKEGGMEVLDFFLQQKNVCIQYN